VRDEHFKFHKVVYSREAENVYCIWFCSKCIQEITYQNPSKSPDFCRRY